MNWFRYERTADRVGPKPHSISSRFGVRANDEAVHCGVCAESRYVVRHGDGSFWIICEACGAKGPREASSREALVSWRRPAGLRALDMEAQLGSICLILVALAAVLGMIGFVLS